MAFCRNLLPILALSVVYCTATNQVPVFLWGDLAKTSLKSNPLLTVANGEFNGILKEEIHGDPFTVVFLEETLSVEDFSLRNADGDTSFPYLRENLANALYLPSVEDPTSALNNLADPEKVDHVKLTENGLSADIEPESGKFLFINMNDARDGESRSDMLSRHNDFMREMNRKLVEKYDQVIAIYTARYPSWTVTESHTRVRRQADQSEGSSYFADGLLLYVGSLVLRNGDRTIDLSGLTASSSVFNGTEQNTTLTFGQNSFTLNFINMGGYWFFDSIKVVNSAGVSEDIRATSEVYAFEGFSYKCGQTVVFTTVNETSPYSITFEDLQIQPFFKTVNETESFGEPIDCVGFFSVPIWSGLFVVFIMLAITFYGIIMMMDIRTMDRFDDPKGKTIAINAGE